MAGRPRSGGAAVAELPTAAVGPARSPDGLIPQAGQRIDYWCDNGGAPRGADVSIWMNDIHENIGHAWTARIRWVQDDTIGHFVMTYPNPGGGADYEVHGLQQLQPLVDQAVKIGQAAVFGEAFVT